MNTERTCQTPDCEQPALWEVPFYFTKDGPAAKRLRTRSLLKCEAHGREARAMNPFLGWRRLTPKD